MKFIVLVKASRDSEAGVPPSAELLTEMGKFNQALVKSGALLAAEGLHPTSKGARIQFAGSRPTVVDGPFSETRELIAGFWLIQVKSREEAIEWMKRAPFQEGEIELRQVSAAEEIATGTPERIARERELRALTESRKN
jgi:hypothetical protein